MASIDGYMHKCIKCNNLKFIEERVYTLSKDQTRSEIVEIKYKCDNCGHIAKVFKGD